MRLRPYRFPCAFPGRRVRLVIQKHSLGRFSKRTMEHRLPTRSTDCSRSGRCVWDLVCPIARSPPDFKPYCTALRGVLFSVRSRYLFAIGLGEYLVLAVDACRVHEGSPTLATLGLTRPILQDTTGLSPCFTLRSRRLRVVVLRVGVSPNTTLPVKASVWTGTRSVALTNVIAVAFSSCRY